jgi:tRNA 2-thiouridine synthesizing protein A
MASDCSISSAHAKPGDGSVADMAAIGAVVGETGLVVDEYLDASGLTCPLPLLKAKQGLNRLAANQVLAVVCTDPGSVRDFQVFARQSGHGLLQTREQGGHYYYWLQKKQ